MAVGPDAGAPTGSAARGPLLTFEVHASLRRALHRGVQTLECSLDLGRTLTTVTVDAGGWQCGGRYPWLENCRQRTVYYWTGAGFAPASRFAACLVKLVPTQWGAPTFEIDGIKMLPTARISPYEDARRKVELVGVRGRCVLDTCGGLGYFAACCLELGAASVLSCEKNPDVLWLRSLNPWSPPANDRLALLQADITAHIATLADASVDAILHDPPRFGIAGELYSRSFYAQLFRVLRCRGRLFHYTGTPNRLGSGRDLPREVTARLQAAGFTAQPAADGVLASK